MIDDNKHFWKLCAILAVIVMAAFSYILHSNPNEEIVKPKEEVEIRGLEKNGN